MNEISQSVPKKTEKQHLAALIAYAKEEIDLKESIKGAKTLAKEDGFKPAALYKVAQAVANGKEEELVAASELLIETVSVYQN